MIFHIYKLIRDNFKKRYTIFNIYRKNVENWGFWFFFGLFFTQKLKKFNKRS